MHINTSNFCTLKYQFPHSLCRVPRFSIFLGTVVIIYRSHLYFPSTPLPKPSDSPKLHFTQYQFLLNAGNLADSTERCTNCPARECH
ncbi:hypothetical protein XELAEV_18022291mg [Xenopus laevis]|uniref:Uncharacterized protein n=1 Tax=Xenopus laevis TaxID=8355 RepID=A0A974D4S9_XENLA|nr:hypothetical protein XELAEV_18022291mg [Xenopus laevis]